MYPIGLSSCAFVLNDENFKKLEQDGISAIEICMPWDKYASIDYKEVAELSLRYHIKLWSFHLPFMPFDVIDISSLDPEMRSRTIELYTSMIEKATAIGIDKFIVHPSGEPIPDADRAERLKYAMDSLDQLANIAHKHGAMIAVEDLPRSCLGNTAEEIATLIGANDKLRVCFDTNHLLRDTNINFLNKLSDKIVTLHVSDYDFIDEKHWLPGEGDVDFAELYAALKKANYQGAWMYEIKLTPTQTRPRSRDLTFRDFIDNAKAIFEGKEPPRIL